MKLVILAIFALLSVQASAASICSISLLKWAGDKTEHLSTITKYVKYGEGGALGQLYSEDEHSTLWVMGAINNQYDANIILQRTDNNGHWSQSLGELKMKGVGQSVSTFIENKYVLMLSCVASK